MQHFAFVPSTSVQGHKKVPQLVRPPELMCCLYPLNLFNGRKEANLGVIKEQGESELTQLCFNDISH